MNDKSSDDARKPWFVFGAMQFDYTKIWKLIFVIPCVVLGTLSAYFLVMFDTNTSAELQSIEGVIWSPFTAEVQSDTGQVLSHVGMYVGAESGFQHLIFNVAGGKQERIFVRREDQARIQKYGVGSRATLFYRKSRFLKLPIFEKYQFKDMDEPLMVRKS